MHLHNVTFYDDNNPICKPCVWKHSRPTPQRSDRPFPAQDLEFTADLLKRGQTSAGVVLETLRLLLPTAPESDLLSLVDALCPKQAAAPPASERDRG